MRQGVVRKVVLIGGDGGLSGVPRHLEHLLAACEQLADFLIVSDVNKGGYSFLKSAPVRHVEIPGLATSLSPFRFLNALIALSRLLREERPDIVWAHSRMGVLLVRLLGIGGLLPQGTKVAITFHGLPFEPGQRRWFASLLCRIERFAQRRKGGQALIFLTPDARRHYENVVGPGACSGHDLLVMPNCSKLRPLVPARSRDTDRRIVLTGRDGWQKNLERALRIFAALPGSYRLTICGAGTNSNGFRKRARKILGAARMTRVTFAGPVDDIRRVLAAADCYLLTSRYEGQPIGALEAFEAGLPMALSDISGTQDILAAHPCSVALTGRHRDEDAMEDAMRIVGLVEDYMTRRHVLEPAIKRAFLGTFSYDAWASAMRDLLEKLCPPKEPTRETGTADKVIQFACRATPAGKYHVGPASEPPLE